MSKTARLTIIILIVVATAVFFILKNDPATSPSAQTSFDARNSTVTVNEQTITLVNGVAETQVASSSASRTTTRYFGNETRGDLNGDGHEDVAFLFTQDTGGSGLFYYVAVALGGSEGYKMTNAFYVGDRIAPQSTEIHADSIELHVNFAERRPGEAMVVPPSVGAVLLLKVTPQGVLEGLMK